MTDRDDALVDEHAEAVERAQAARLRVADEERARRIGKNPDAAS